MVQLIKLFDIYEGKAAVLILQAVFESKPEMIEDVDFGGWPFRPTTSTQTDFVHPTEEFYTTLTPSSILLARTYFAHLRTTSNPLLSDLEPVLTSLAFHIQREVDELFQLLRAESDDSMDVVEQKERERRKEAKVFVVRGLVEIALESDFGDEIGRRKVFELMRTSPRSFSCKIPTDERRVGDLLSHPLLPPSLIPHTLDVLRKGTEERDFLRIVVEIIQGLRNDSLLISDNEEEDEEDGSENEATQDRVRRKALRGGAVEGESEETRVERRRELDLRCLSIVQALLERVMGVRTALLSSPLPLCLFLHSSIQERTLTISLRQALQENSTLHGIVHELIVPSVRSKDFEIRAVGLGCLGLCCLLDKVRLSLASYLSFSRDVLTRIERRTWRNHPGSSLRKNRNWAKESYESRFCSRSSISSSSTGSISSKSKDLASVLPFFCRLEASGKLIRW